MADELTPEALAAIRTYAAHCARLLNHVAALEAQQAALLGRHAETVSTTEYDRMQAQRVAMEAQNRHELFETLVDMVLKLDRQTTAYAKAMERIKELEARLRDAEARGLEVQWRSCDESLPAPGQRCLITVERIDGPGAYELMVDQDVYDDELPDGERMGGWSVDTDPDLAVIAWMPLPVPYVRPEERKEETP